MSREIRPALAAALLAWAMATLAAPIDPGIDDVPGPFSYFSRPSTVLGVADGDEGTQVGPEGWLWTGSAQLIFLAGPDLEPLRQRIHTLQDGVLPIVSHSTTLEGIQYRLTMFGATLDGRPESDLVNFVRATMTNTGGTPATASFATALRGEGPHCCDRLRRPWVPLRARYELTGECALRDGRVMYTFDAKHSPLRLIVPDKPGSGPIEAGQEGVIIRAPVCMVRYDIELAPGESRDLDFKMPYLPVSAEDAAAVAALLEADLDTYLAQTETWWREYLGRGMQIELAERKVTDTYTAGLMYDSIARDKHGEDYIPTVNQFQYHYFWIRDGAYIVNAFDLAGRHRWAEQGLDYFLKHQRDNGIIYQPPQLDGFGQTLWAFGSHWRLTGDGDWARRVYPALCRHVRGAFVEIDKDPLGLVPAAPPYDNEAIDGHYTGHSFWMLIGMQDMIAMARALGHDEDAREFAELTEGYRERFERALTEATDRTGGYIPPGLDAEEGCDWDNLISLYPRGGVPARGALSPTDPRVTETVDRVRQSKYAEGIMTYGPGLRVGSLHHYDTIKLTEALVALGRQQDTLADFYSILAHTSSTQAGFEFCITPWDNRDPGGNYPPHGWFAVEYIGLLRNMLVRELDGDLHLLGVVSPEWMKPGDRIAVRRAPTDFGVVSLTADVARDGMTVRIGSRWRQAPASLIVHLPWFVNAVSARADGKSVPIGRAPYGEGQQIALSPGVRALEVRWNHSAPPKLSYANTVERWKQEYRERFEAYVARGGRPEPLWPEASLPMTAEARRESWAALEAQAGIAVGCEATASSSEPGNGPEHAVDGSVGREAYWGATPFPAWWQVDLGRQVKIDRVRVVTYFDPGGDGRAYRYRLLSSTDGESWTELAKVAEADEQRATQQGRMHTFTPVTARYVRVEMLHNSANTGVHLVEVMVYPAVVAPLAAPPAQPRVAWTAEEQTGAVASELPNWAFIGAQRIVLRGEAVKVGGDRARLQFGGAPSGSIAIGDVSIALTDPENPADILPGSRVPVTFAEANCVEIPAGETVSSDWVCYSIPAGRDLTVTFSVLREGAASLWSSESTQRYESRDAGAATAGRWSSLQHSTTYNLYFLSRLETG